MQITIKAAQRILSKIPSIGDKVISISKKKIIYSNKHIVSLPYTPNNNLKLGDVVVSVHIDLEIKDKAVRISLDHNSGGVLIGSRIKLEAEIRDINLEQILN